MKRILTALAGLALATGIAPAAHAGGVTNPADNPHPITVKGDDGNTYTDGQDTLPGYDDYECTYIPGAWFDFDNNKVHYADGQSIPWTEWERATGYKEWQAKQGSTGGGSTPTKPKPSAKPSSGGASTSSGSTKSSTGKSGSTKGSGTAVSTPGATATSGPVATDPATPGATPSAGATTSTTAAAGTGDAAQAAGTTEADVIEPTAARSSTSSGSSGAGLLILGGLGAVGVAAVAGYGVLGRRRKERA